jgi:hypothetical protein
MQPVPEPGITHPAGAAFTRELEELRTASAGNAASHRDGV